MSNELSGILLLCLIMACIALGVSAHNIISKSPAQPIPVPPPFIRRRRYGAQRLCALHTIQAKKAKILSIVDDKYCDICNFDKRSK